MLQLLKDWVQKLYGQPKSCYASSNFTMYDMMRSLYLIPHLMQLDKSIPFGRTHRKYDAKIHSTVPALQLRFAAAYDTTARTRWHFEWLVVVERFRLYWRTFQLNDQE